MTTDTNVANQKTDNNILIRDVTELFQELRQNLDSYKSLTEENAISQIKTLYSIYIQNETKVEAYHFKHSRNNTSIKAIQTTCL